MPITRRQFALGSASALAFAGLAANTSAEIARGQVRGYGDLVPDPLGVFDLPADFSYRTISRTGDRMSDGFYVPDRADGMGVFDLGGDRIALVRNHENSVRHFGVGAERGDTPPLNDVYDRDSRGRAIAGGTTTIVWNTKTGQREREYLSLAGTIRNCAGGTTPWGSWLSCEEDMTRAGDGVGKDHGWIFEVPARHVGLAAPVPLTAMGRFNHEAAAVDPRTGIVYLTEDRADGLFYRFLPNARGELAKGGRLQALAIDGVPDTRNWREAALPARRLQKARWIDMTGVDAPDDDLRQRGAQCGAALFARGEGIHFERGELFFACTSGGAAKVGQIFRYRPARDEGQGARGGDLELFFESPEGAIMNYADNLTVAPWGHLIVCEDRSGNGDDNYLRGVTPDGRAYPFARLRLPTELAGACFSPDGRTLFVNFYAPGQTVAITGPWHRFQA